MDHGFVAYQVLQNRDAELLARAAQVPLAAIGSVSGISGRPMQIRLGEGHSADARPLEFPTDDIIRLARELIAYPSADEPDAIDCDAHVETLRERTAVPVWLKSKRCLFLGYRPVAGTAPFVALVCDGKGSPISRWQKELARLALMQETERLYRATGGKQNWEGGSVLREVLDCLAFPIALVERSGRLVYCNAAAQGYFKSSRSLRVEGDKLSSTHAHTHNRLHLAIREAASSSQSEPYLLLLPGESGGCISPQVSVYVSPCSIQPGLALLVCAFSRPDEKRMTLLLSSLGLTAAERRLASGLISGDCLESVAQRSNLKISTARSYLRNIFDKTGTSRQGQLVASALSLLPPTSSAMLSNNSSKNISPKPRGTKVISFREPSHSRAS